MSVFEGHRYNEKHPAFRPSVIRKWWYQKNYFFLAAVFFFATFLVAFLTVFFTAFFATFFFAAIKMLVGLFIRCVWFRPYKIFFEKNKNNFLKNNFVTKSIRDYNNYPTYKSHKQLFFHKTVENFWKFFLKKYFFLFLFSKKIILKNYFSHNL